MAPVIWELKKQKWARPMVWSTAQHRDMLGPLLRFLRIDVDHDFDVMTENQDLSSLAARVLQQIHAQIDAERPDLIIAQGDTTTVMATALAAFHARVPFAHIEAGLRTGDLSEPFPEEFNRVLAGRVATLHFAPTESAYANLVAEGTNPDTIWITGNTVIDTLLDTRERLGGDPNLPVTLNEGQRLMLVTLHRRESFGIGLDNVFAAICLLLERFPDLVVLYPVHPNPNVRIRAHELLGGLERVKLVEPLDYGRLVHALSISTLVLTDSGGLQEEAPALGKPVFVARSTTERPEALTLGCARLVGTDTPTIFREVSAALSDPAVFAKMSQGASPYGDGRAAPRIVEHIRAWGDACALRV